MKLLCAIVGVDAVIMDDGGVSSKTAALVNCRTCVAFRSKGQFARLNMDPVSHANH